jgi:hypothetical protein
MTADRGVNRQKSLCLLERLESAHSPLAFSCGLMGILRPVVQPESTLMSDSGQHTRKRGRVAAERFFRHLLKSTDQDPRRLPRYNLRQGERDK